MSNPAFWTAIPESDSDSNDDDEDWSLPPPDPVKEAEIRAALEAASALKLKKQEEEMKYESEEDKRKREREERRKQLLLEMEQSELSQANENTAPLESSNTFPDEAPGVPKKKALPGVVSCCYNAHICVANPLFQRGCRTCRKNPCSHTPPLTSSTHPLPLHLPPTYERSVSQNN
jgi:hypothetical protein